MFRVLRPEGVVCCTAYLLNQGSLSQMLKNSGAVKFPFEHKDPSFTPKIVPILPSGILKNNSVPQ